MQEPQPMFPNFSAVSKKDWLAKLNEDLKGKPYAELQWKTYEGFSLEPYYSRAELYNFDYLKELHNSQLSHGNSGSGSPRQWVNNQYIKVKNEKEANTIALQALNGGADGIYFDVSKIQEVKLDLLLKDILLNHCSVSFLAGNDADRLLSNYLRYAKENGIQAEELQGLFNFDPVGEIAESGLIDSDHFSSFSAINEKTGKMPRFYGITVNTSSFHDSGGSAVQEIAFGLNIAVAYLHHLTDAGMSVANAVGNLCVSVATGTSYFMEIAKLRAFRYLFSKIVHSYGLNEYQPGDLYIHARADVWSSSLLDPHTNMLRLTTQAMSAILGGCNALTIPAYDNHFAEPGSFSRRISRNVSTILKEEAYFDKVADAAAGSYYIETITDKLIHSAWALFLEVEEKGGFSRAFEKGFIQEEVRRVRQKKLENIHKRKQKLVGVNAYAQPDEKLSKASSPSLPEHEQLLWPQRRGAAYERLRQRTEAYIATGHPRPQALLLQFGDASMSRARAAFATDFLRCAGFTTREAQIQPQSSQLPTLLQKEEIRMVVFCAADTDYVAEVPELADYIRQFQQGLLLVAGHPDAMQEVKNAAIDGFIHLRSDALDVLTEIQDKLFGGT